MLLRYTIQRIELISHQWKKEELLNGLRTVFREKIRVIFIDGQVLEGGCNTFTNKFDTEDELYDEITIKTDSHPYVSFNESEVESIEVLHG